MDERPRLQLDVLIALREGTLIAKNAYEDDYRLTIYGPGFQKMLSYAEKTYSFKKWATDHTCYFSDHRWEHFGEINEPIGATFFHLASTKTPGMIIWRDETSDRFLVELINLTVLNRWHGHAKNPVFNWPG